MHRALHIVDPLAPADMLDHLRLLARQGETIVSVGPAPRYGPLKLPILATHRPLNSATLCGLLRMRPLAGEATILHAWSPTAALAGRMVCRRLGLRMALSLPCVPGRKDLPRLTAWAARHRVHLTVPTAPAAKRLVAAGAPPKAVHVLPPPAMAFDDRQGRRARTRQSLRLDDRDILLLAPAEMTAWAGHKYASWAHAILRQLLPDLRLLLPGGGPAESRVRFFAGTTGYDGEVIFSGERFSPADVLAAADIALFFCLRDCGLAALGAAMAAGLPIAASATADIAACAAHEQTALLVKPGDPREASAAILRLIEDPGLAARLGQAAHRHATEALSAPAVRRRLDEIYTATTASL